MQSRARPTAQLLSLLRIQKASPGPAWQRLRRSGAAHQAAAWPHVEASQVAGGGSSGSTGLATARDLAPSVIDESQPFEPRQRWAGDSHRTGTEDWRHAERRTQKAARRASRVLSEKPPAGKRIRRPFASGQASPAYVPAAMNMVHVEHRGTVHSHSDASPHARTNLKPTEDEVDFTFEEYESEPAHAERSRDASAAAAVLQSKLAAARNVGHILELVKAHLTDMDPLHVATSLHRLARHAPRGPRRGSQFISNPEVDALLDKFCQPDQIEQLSHQSCCCLLWAVGKLGLSPPWLPSLLQACAKFAPELSSHQLATVLHSIAKLDAAIGNASLLCPIDPSHGVSVLEALHEELRRRQHLLGPGGASAMDATLIVDALARLRVRDRDLFAALADALQLHLKVGALDIREVRHVSTAFANMSFVDANLSAAVSTWLTPRLSACSSSDVVAVTGSLARVGHVAGSPHEQLFAALRPDVLKRISDGELRTREAAYLLYTFSEVGATDEELVRKLAEVVQLSPRSLNGHDLALLVPCISPELAGEQPGLIDALAMQTTRCASMLSTKQLARLACGFGETGAATGSLWKILNRESLARATYFAAPDVLRVIAGLNAAGAADHETMRAMWTAAEAKHTKFLAEETLTLLQLWPRLDARVRNEKADLPRKLLENLQERVERGARKGWQAPLEFATELFEWLPQSRNLDTKGQMDTRLARAAFVQLPDQMSRASLEDWAQLLAALSVFDGELLARSRAELQRQMVIRRAFDEKIRYFLQVPFDKSFASSLAFRCAALGFDNPSMRDLLRALLQSASADSNDASASSAKHCEFLSQVCWACAEVRAHVRDALRLTARLAGSEVIGEDNEIASQIVDPTVSWLRLAWASLALGGSEAEIGALLEQMTRQESHGGFLVQNLSPADVRAARQLAWHSRQRGLDLGGTSSWVDALLAQQPRSGAQGVRSGSVQPFYYYDAGTGRRISELLQHLRVPHVASSHLALPGGIYKVPAWFPQPRAVLDIDARGDRLASGAPGGAAELRRRQLREAGLRVHTVDGTKLFGTGAASAPSRALQLRAVAEAVSASCPEATSWLESDASKGAVGVEASASGGITEPAAREAHDV